MILDNAPQDQAVMSNVGQIGEFSIRNSSKAFSILSSGLYANKVKAIIRELSCNAIDSHKAAGKEDTKFTVHLPTALEPYFSIRDYGIGLTHEQVTNLYTTYFESTKTMSNDFIGALGLGSKSPFSYTDNFTVIAIKDGRKGIYTAFINQEGVPSIALMSEEMTDEVAGVEIKFAVNTSSDFRKFQDEAEAVYKWFTLKPEIVGVTNFVIDEIKYETKEIVPGVHHVGKDPYRNTISYAVMGNIAYPIDIPSADTTIPTELKDLLSCNLVMEFGIGELDFQASREGLSYIPLTIESIKKKLEALNKELTAHITKEADAISNLWLRADYLQRRKVFKLWAAAALEYTKNTNFDLIETNNWGWNRKRLKMSLAELSSKYNILIRGFNKEKGSNTCSTYKPKSRMTDNRDSNGRHIYEEYVEFEVSGTTHFVINDTKIGAVERAKYHWREVGIGGDVYSNSVFVLEAADKTKAIDTEQFFKDIYNPPYIVKASDLAKKERVNNSVGKDVSILKLIEKNYGGWRNKDYVWQAQGDIKKFDTSKTYYYVPLSGFESLLKYDNKKLANDLNKGLGLNFDIYGVRKGDIEEVKKLKNWISIDVAIKDHFKNLKDEEILSYAKSVLDIQNVFCYNGLMHTINKNSPYRKFAEKFQGVEKCKNSITLATNLAMHFCKYNPFEKMVQDIKNEFDQNVKRYKMLSYVSYVSPESDVKVAEYVNLIDNVKGV